MRRVQRLIGVTDAKPASLSTSPSNGSMNAYASANMSASSDTPPNFLAPPSGSATNWQHGSAQSPQSPSTPGSYIGGSRGTPQPLSPNAHQQYFDLSPSAASGQPQSVRPVTPVQASLSRPVSPQPLATPATANVPPVDRSDLHKSLKALEGLLVNLDEYRELSIRMAKVQKKLAKSASDLEKIKVVREAPSQALQVSSTMFEALHEVSSKHAKQVQKEYEAINDSSAKYFKRVAKEERAHDELVEGLDAKIKKANAAHEKAVKKATANKALESHDRYIATVQGLAGDITRAKTSHAASMGAKSHFSSLMIASTVGGLADLEFRRTCETVRRMGPSVGRLNELLCYTSSEFMPGMSSLDLDEAETGKAEQFAKVAAKMESQVQAQAEADARANKENEMLLMAQQLGWTPPSAALNGAKNLGRVSSFASTNRSVSGDTQPVATKAIVDTAQVPSLDSQGQLLAPNVLDSISGSRPRDAVSVHSVATDRTPRQHEQPVQLVNHSRMSVRPTQTTSSILTSDRSAAQQADTFDGERGGANVLGPDSSFSNSAQGSEDGGRLPRTPDDSEGNSSVLGPRDFQQVKTQHHDYESAMSRNGLGLGRPEADRRPAERALEQYRAATSGTRSYIVDGSDNSATADSRQERQDHDTGDRVAPSRKVSLWERERERMKQLEREDEMQRQLSQEDQGRYRHGVDRSSGSGSDSLSRTGSGFYSSRNKSTGMRPRHSEPPVSERNSSLGLGFPRPTAAELDQFAPAVGSTRLSATGVTRSLSTDTTASERSFVSRMKARYQDEKDIEREQRELNVLDKERAARRITMDPGSRRVPEIASRYQAQTLGAGSLPLTYAQEVPGRRYHDSLPVTSGSSRVSSARLPQDVDEFGLYRKGESRRDAEIVSKTSRGPLPAVSQSTEPIHSDICGCHQCSARHYTTVSKAEDRGLAPTKSGKPLSPRPFNVRRTTMPAPKRSDQDLAQLSSPRPTETVSAIYGASSRRDDQLYTPAHAPQGRRSFEDAAGDRKVMFAHESSSRR